MSLDPETTRIVRSWLDEGVTELPDRVLDTVLAELPATQRRRATWWPARSAPTMNKFMTFGLGAAVVVVIVVLLGSRFFGSPANIGGPGVEATPTMGLASASPVMSPSPTPVVSGSLPQGGSVIQGSYEIGDPFPIQLGLDIGPGWTMWSGALESTVVALYKGSPDPPAGEAIGFLIVNNVYADPCDSSAGQMDPPVGPAPMDLAEALASQTGTESTDPIQVEIDGYSGVYLDYRNTGECGTMERWPGRAALVGERDQVWILDVDGTRLVIDAASFQGTSADDVAEMRTMVESLTIGP